MWFPGVCVCVCGGGVGGGVDKREAACQRSQTFSYKMSKFRRPQVQHGGDSY